MSMGNVAEVRRLQRRDPEIGQLAFPGGTMTLRHGSGSGLAMGPGEPPGHFWAIADRGPNIKVRDAIRRYGLNHLEPGRHDGPPAVMKRLLGRIQDEAGMRRPAGAPADDPPSIGIDDEAYPERSRGGDVDEPRPGRDIGMGPAAAQGSRGFT